MQFEETLQIIKCCVCVRVCVMTLPTHNYQVKAWVLAQNMGMQLMKG